MAIILNLYFDDKKEQSIEISSPYKEFDTLTLFDFIKVTYCGGFVYDMFEYEVQYTIQGLFIDSLQDALHNKVSLDSSIKKPLGYYEPQYFKNPKRKNLKYIINPNGKSFWVGRRYKMFDATGYIPQTTWLYNDQTGDIWFEISPVYPWLFSSPQEGEVFVKFRQWLKDFKPYVVRKISKETAKQWVKQLQDLLKVIEANDKRLTCTGPGCKLCKEEGSELYKQYCSCERGEEIHNNS